jgi:hypothetical protein
MKINGRRIRTVFDRYHVVSPTDLQDAAQKIAGTFSGTPTQNEKGAAFATP